MSDENCLPATSPHAARCQGFSAANKLGCGGYGPVFRGRLDGVPVAVKLLDMSGHSQQGVAEFKAEVGILSRLHHPHIVLLMGSCPERCALVYELLDHGSLEQHLFSPSMPDLQWQVGGMKRCRCVSGVERSVWPWVGAASQHWQQLLRQCGPDLCVD